MANYESLDSLIDRYTAAVTAYHLNVRDGNKRQAHRQFLVIDDTRIELMHYGWTEHDHRRYMAEVEQEVRNGN